ncbi:DUF4097 domain-containing protein [Psychrosphaera sp. B3R10]|uniref:DUF4097 family beta strand repeat-containing protein n=1 Tax=Psychrosphaera algicola TaxID=3023714 RepID=A0ABT5FEW9_9GAMM|nr:MULTISPECIES: DUF4097 family beta strand repeat-containing protein [unclassified Psychrosphaera]MBU2880616.1 DUF4097 domain-containing protein [Psychrosphaera sp. I2R16]MBU2990702.1 DUF4097 domain-containing protein [Psychrosphaera sp. B3R10]MDC2890101.1 DUF4097 family beta strand repeat-containing protein [Psychrosphaera sp. G1-22]
MKKLFVKFTILALFTTAISACVIHVGGNKGQKANVQLTEKLELDATGLRNFEIEAGAGDLTIRGIEGQTNIIVEASIFTTKQKDYQLTLRKNGKSAELVAKHDGSSGYWIGSSPRIHLQITMPLELALTIDDGSGDISISNVTNGIAIDDGSGNILLNQVAKDIVIDDGSGDIVVKNADGNVWIDDGSGELYIANIKGNVDIEDGSGDLTVTQISGLVTIDDGSGDISINTAGGLTIIESGSGGLAISGIKGNVSIDD